MTTTGKYERFRYFDFETTFLKTENLFQKHWSTVQKRTKIENASFLYNTALSEANVKTNKMGSTKWTYHKERSLASNYFIFLKFCFSLRTSYEELICCTSYPNFHIHTFRKHLRSIWGYFVPVSILKDSFISIY